jgi:hypothetical protein
MTLAGWRSLESDTPATAMVLGLKSGVKFTDVLRVFGFGAPSCITKTIRAAMRLA